MKVLHVAESIKGGCGTYLDEIVPLQVQALGERQVRCLVPREHAAQLPRVEPGLVRTFGRPGRAAGLPRLARELTRLVDEWQPDLIHAHSTFAGAVSRALSVARRLPPIVYCPHGWVFDVEQPRLMRWATESAERLMAPRSARIVAISDAERRRGEAAGIPAERLVVVPNGIHAKAPMQRAVWPMPRLRVLFVGRLDRQKGVDVLIEAARDLGDKVSVRIVGDAVVAGGRPAPNGDARHIEFLGWMDSAGVAAQINACDVVVMPSRWEGFGLVAVEAMRAGKPVWASAVGGLREVVADGFTGRLFPVGDAAALRTLLRQADRAALRRMGAAGRERFLAHYTSDRTHQALLRLYADVLQLAPSAAARPEIAGEIQ
ncbi:glycosyltransferase [Azohydromonas caseinilytica]|uniref:Glycosyltransferase family 4 protein n=1 Tax=Azohydromonas caseinilytica TaxID=2728836 RepID=A0A848FHT9_9BURK|nr:glycosyltransferase [Azohydromonas caseinilytica]NML17770.1 glycosyltransferase family 4 protein [Azohydromonas caseinilytica]